MKTQNIKEKLTAIAPVESTSWLEKANYVEENEGWLDRSAEIALVVLRTLRAKSMTQVALAEALNLSPQYVNKIVKGKENLTLETIDKLEKALGITLIAVPATFISEYSSTLEIDDTIVLGRSQYTESFSKRFENSERAGVYMLTPGEPEYDEAQEYKMVS